MGVGGSSDEYAQVRELNMSTRKERPCRDRMAARCLVNAVNIFSTNYAYECYYDNVRERGLGWKH